MAYVSPLDFFYLRAIAPSRLACDITGNTRRVRIHFQSLLLDAKKSEDESYTKSYYIMSRKKWHMSDLQTFLHLGEKAPSRHIQWVHVLAGRTQIMGEFSNFSTTNFANNPIIQP